MILQVQASLAALVLAASIAMSGCKNPAPTPTSPHHSGSMGEGGQATLDLPTDLRTWIHAGSPVTPNDMNSGKAAFPEFHNVLVEPSAFAHWEKTGQWKQGTMIAKELFAVGTKSAESGNGYFMGKNISLEIMLKDSQRHPSSPGNWGFYGFGHPAKAQATVQPEASCVPCHNTSAQDDMVFTQYYPVLAQSKSKPVGTLNGLQWTANGQLVRPNTGYRKWVYIGTPLTPHDMNNGKAAFPEFHTVYIDPSAFAAYKSTGAFPQGTTIVKELNLVAGKKAESGNGYFMGEFAGLEVLVKDKKRFPDEPGNWAFFSFGHKYPLADKATMMPTADCNSCHESSANDDFVFTQYYPILAAAKGTK